jgi:hypothetical protein
MADTDAYSVFADTGVQAVVYCPFHNLDRGFIIFVWKVLKFQITVASRKR